MRTTKKRKRPTKAQRRKVSLTAKIVALEFEAQADMQRRIKALEDTVVELHKLVLERVPNVNLPVGEYRPPRMGIPMCGGMGGLRVC